LFSLFGSLKTIHKLKHK